MGKCGCVRRLVVEMRGMDIEALCAAPPEALTHSPGQMPPGCSPRGPDIISGNRFFFYATMPFATRGSQKNSARQRFDDGNAQGDGGAAEAPSMGNSEDHDGSQTERSDHATDPVAIAPRKRLLLPAQLSKFI